MKQFENICVQPRNFGNVVTTFLTLIIIGKVFDHTFPEVLPVWDTSYPKIPKTKQFENIWAQPRNLGNVVTTFLILIITGKVFDHTFPEVLLVWDTSYPKILKTKYFENIRLQPINLGNVVTTFLILIITGKV